MCPPVLMAVSGIASGVGALMANGAQKAGYKANAEANRREAGVQQTIGFSESQKVQRDLNQAVGQSIASQAANGIDVSTGSAINQITDISREADLDIKTIQWNAGQKADKLKYQAQVDEMNAKSVGRAAPFAFLSPVLESAVKIGGTFAKAA